MKLQFARLALCGLVGLLRADEYWDRRDNCLDVIQEFRNDDRRGNDKRGWTKVCINDNDSRQNYLCKDAPTAPSGPSTKYSPEER